MCISHSIWSRDGDIREIILKQQTLGKLFWSNKHWGNYLEATNIKENILKQQRRFCFRTIENLQLKQQWFSSQILSNFVAMDVYKLFDSLLEKNCDIMFSYLKYSISILLKKMFVNQRKCLNCVLFGLESNLNCIFMAS